MVSERVVVAEILRPRGNRGELLALSETDVPGRLESLKQAQAHLRGGADVPVVIDEAWTHAGRWVFHFEGVDSIEAAERFAGAELWVPASERGQLPDGEYFRSDLLGCTLRDQSTGSDIGKVTGFHDCGGPLLLEVRHEHGEALVPFVPTICRSVDVAAKVITASLPEGLLEL